MVLRSLGIVAVMVLAVQTIGQAEAACQSIEGAVCGGTGNGSISSVVGNVSLAQGTGVSRATSGASVSPGVRILAGDGAAAQVNLGAGCFASVAPNSVATLTSRSGVTCLRQNEPFTAQATGNDRDRDGFGDDRGRIAGGVVLAIIAGAIGLGIEDEFHHHHQPLSP
jgi:hypothetical protein